MFYLAIDQHAKQITVNLRNESGTVTLRRQVSTQPEKVRTFFSKLRDDTATDGGYVAILEVCGFNDWLLALLTEYGCQDTVLTQRELQDKHKTDRRDAHKLGEMLWVNRHRLAAGERLQNLRRVNPPSREDAAARQITQFRKRLGVQRTRVTNRIGGLLKKHNLQHACPTKGMKTRRARKWLAEVSVGPIDRLELDQLITQWKLVDEQVTAVEVKIKELQAVHRPAAFVSSIPGLKGYSGLAIASRVGDINHFPTPDSLANYWGLTPGCRNSGNAKQRLGSITKQGSPLVRFLLSQAVMHVLRADPYMRKWYCQVKARRGAKIARVGVMRRLAVAIWYMLKHEEPYCTEGTPVYRRPPNRQPAPAGQRGRTESSGAGAPLAEQNSRAGALLTGGRDQMGP